MEPMIQTRINQRWSLLLPQHRAQRPGWAWWERDALSYLHAVIRPGDVVWDVGAEEGDLSALYASWGAEVVLFEPSPSSWVWIRQTFAANDLPARGCVMALVGNEQVGDVGDITDWPAAAFGDEHPDFGFRHLNEKTEDHPVVMLDTVSPPTPHVVVMDIEGAEYQALLGAQQLINQIRPIFMISVHPEFMRERYGDTPDDLLCMMELANYDCHYIGYDHERHYLFKPRA